jgi:glucose/arabinose dehydrogenase
LIAERNSGAVKHMTAPGVVTQVGGVAGIAARGEGGLLGLDTSGQTVFAYITTAQDRSSLGGKILRINPDGSIPSDNPGSPVWSFGHRNIQGLAWDSAGRPWATELGANRLDELNLIRPGGNYGSPMAEGRATRLD